MAKQWFETLDTDLVFHEQLGRLKHVYTYKDAVKTGVTTINDKTMPKPALPFWYALETVKHLGYFDAKKMVGTEISDAMVILENRRKEIAGMTPEKYLAELENAKKSPTQKKEEAAQVGKEAHAWIEAHIKHALLPEENPYPDMPEDPRVVAAVTAFLGWESKEPTVYIASERKLYSKRWDVAGTADVLAKRNGKMTLIDIKTSNGIWPEHFAQTAAYAAMLEETHIVMKVDSVWLIRLGKEDGKFYDHENNGELREAFEEKFDNNVKSFFLDKKIAKLLSKED